MPGVETTSARHPRWMEVMLGTRMEIRKGVAAESWPRKSVRGVTPCSGQNVFFSDAGHVWRLEVVRCSCAPAHCLPMCFGKASGAR